MLSNVSSAQMFTPLLMTTYLPAGSNKATVRPHSCYNDNNNNNNNDNNTNTTTNNNNNNDNNNSHANSLSLSLSLYLSLRSELGSRESY